MRRALALGVFLAVVATTSLGEAHYFWVQPEAFTVRDKTPLTVRLFNGHAEVRKEYPYVPPNFKRFDALGPKNTVTISGRIAKKPAGTVTLEGKGVHTLVYLSNHTFLTLDPPKFEKYLREKGLDAIIADRAKRGETSKPGKESFARYAKALVRVGHGMRGYNRKVGLAIEITALDNPLVAHKRRKVRFQLEFRGKPLAGARVELMSLAGDLSVGVVKARTNAKGQVRFVIPRTGRWMVAATHMLRAKKPISGDWQSFWASLTFASSPK